MPPKHRPKPNKDNISKLSRYEYSEMLDVSSESDRLLESEIQMLVCANEYELEAPLNHFNDNKLNDHLYYIFSKFRGKPATFMRTWVCFFVHQHRTKITARVQ